MNLKFTKMHGLGNDFVVFDFTVNPVTISPQQARLIADRHTGVGCDQILIVEQSTKPGVDFKYRIINADGSEVGQCGNGARCFVRYAHDKGLTDKNPITVETLNGELTLQEDPDGLVTVNMGIPSFEPADIPLDVKHRQDSYSLVHDGKDIQFSALSMGNPHAVILVDNVGNTPVLETGAALEPHSLFPEKANIGFMQINTKSDIHLRVFERGSGETNACGSGACAAVVAGIQLSLLDNSVTVHLTGGDLAIQWSGEGHPVMMTGPAVTSFEGQLTL